MEGSAVKLSRTAEVAKKVLEDGHVIANHSFSHPVLSKLPEAQRNKEIDQTNALLEKVAGQKALLFRPPYGARNKAILQQLNSEGLKNVMWNIDSLDWADPIPESIAMRVLHELSKQQKGIILFHDIHKQSVMALSAVIEELQRQDYTFLAFDKGEFVKSTPPPVTERASTEVQTAAVEGRRSFYRESWAVIVGINDYQNWPKLRYAVNDANGVEEALVTRFGFKRENIRKLINGDATRQRIMEVLGDEFTDGRKVQREDRVFFFFAGHGATRSFEGWTAARLHCPGGRRPGQLLLDRDLDERTARGERPDCSEAHLFRDGLLLQRAGALARLGRLFQGPQLSGGDYEACFAADSDGRRGGPASGR